MEITKKTIATLFKDSERNPFQATEGQCEIFESIIDDNILRVVIKAVTQYGKSKIASMALLFLCNATSKKILIIAPTQEQSRIIMGYLIDHVFDNEGFLKNLEVEGGLDRFKRERSKTRIDFKTGARVQILTANVKTLSQEAKGLMGFGADIVLVDESGLIPDLMYSKIFRMIGGVKNGKIIQLSNPWDRNHFYKAFFDDNYKKISINWQQALKEGRLTKEFLDEAKQIVDPIDWQVFYECEFPEYSTDRLIPLKKIEEAINRDLPKGRCYLGVDIARYGSDKTVALTRRGSFVSRIEQWEQKDTMETVGNIKNIVREESPEVINIDVIGVGAGVVDRLNEDDYNISGINVGSKPSNSERFANLRAEIYWNLRERFLQGDISIPDDKELIEQLADINYTFNSKGQYQIESKDSIKKRGSKSPDKADALSLAFYSQPLEESVEFTFA